MVRNALITGAGQGIGFGIAQRLAEDGFHVYVTDYDARLATEAAARVGGTALVVDVTDPASVRDAASRVPAIGALINCAGIYPRATLRDVTLDEFERVYALNVRGVLLTSQLFHAHLAADGSGSIVNISSMSAEVPGSGIGAYAASKAAVNALTRQAAVEFAPDGIRANGVAPGFVQTEGTGLAVGDGEAPRRTPYIPAGRLAVPADIAGVVSFLCSSDSRYVTGQTLLADGGFAGNSFELYRMLSNSAG